MDTTSVILSVLLSAALLVFFAPGVLRMNRGKILQNTALWLAIFMALGLAYKTIGPGALPVAGIESPQENSAPASQQALEPRV